MITFKAVLFVAAMLVADGIEAARQNPAEIPAAIASVLAPPSFDREAGDSGKGDANASLLH